MKYHKGLALQIADAVDRFQRLGSLRPVARSAYELEYIDERLRAEGFDLGELLDRVEALEFPPVVPGWTYNDLPVQGCRKFYIA